MLSNVLSNKLVLMLTSKAHTLTHTHSPWGPPHTAARLYPVSACPTLATSLSVFTVLSVGRGNITFEPIPAVGIFLEGPMNMQRENLLERS